MTLEQQRIEYERKAKLLQQEMDKLQRKRRDLDTQREQLNLDFTTCKAGQELLHKDLVDTYLQLGFLLVTVKKSLVSAEDKNPVYVDVDFWGWDSETGEQKALRTVRVSKDNLPSLYDLLKNQVLDYPDTPAQLVDVGFVKEGKEFIFDNKLIVVKDGKIYSATPPEPEKLELPEPQKYFRPLIQVRTHDCDETRFAFGLRLGLNSLVLESEAAFELGRNFTLNFCLPGITGGGIALDVHAVAMKRVLRDDGISVCLFDYIDLSESLRFKINEYIDPRINTAPVGDFDKYVKVRLTCQKEDGTGKKYSSFTRMLSLSGISADLEPNAFVEVGQSMKLNFMLPSRDDSGGSIECLAKITDLDQLAGETLCYFEFSQIEFRYLEIIRKYCAPR